MSRMVWATAAEVRKYLGDRLPDTVADAELDKLIARAVRRLAPKVLRIPDLDDQDRPADEDVKGHVIAAVGEVVDGLHSTQEQRKQLGAMGDIIANGGNIKAGSLSVDGPTNSNQKGYGDERLLPIAAVEALQAARMVGGSVPAW